MISARMQARAERAERLAEQAEAHAAESEAREQRYRRSGCPASPAVEAIAARRGATVRSVLDALAHDAAEDAAWCRRRAAEHRHTAELIRGGWAPAAT